MKDLQFDANKRIKVTLKLYAGNYIITYLLSAIYIDKTNAGEYFIIHIKKYTESKLE